MSCLHLRPRKRLSDLLHGDLRDVADLLVAEDLDLRARRQQRLLLVRVECDGADVARALCLNGEQSRIAAAAVHEIARDLLIARAAGDAPPGDGGTHGVLRANIDAEATPQRALLSRQRAHALQQKAQIAEV